MREYACVAVLPIYLFVLFLEKKTLRRGKTNKTAKQTNIQRRFLSTIDSLFDEEGKLKKIQRNEEPIQLINYPLQQVTVRMR